MEPLRDLKGSVLQISYSLYELYRPPTKPTMQVLLFHGLERQYAEVCLSAWMSGDGSGTMWPQTWFVDDFPGAQVLSVSYQELVTGRGKVDMYITVDNLMSDIINARVGQDARCPVVLVGHSFGGLVMKELCVQIWSRIKYDPDSRLKTFFNSVNGLFFYSTPHQGFPTMEAVTLLLSKSDLQEFVQSLNQRAARYHLDFERLREQYNWLIAGIGEALPTDCGGARALMVVPAASSKYGDFANAAHTDHFTVCKPTSKMSPSFTAIRNFVTQMGASIHQVRGVPRYFAGYEERLQDIQRLLTEKAIVGIVGMGGIGKTATAKLVFNEISREFEYTSFVEDVKNIPSHTLEDWLLSHCYRRGALMDPSRIQWSHLEEKKTLIVMDDVYSVEQLLSVDRLSRFGNGSCLIITTRDRSLLDIYEQHAIYYVPFLPVDEATRLFCHHVFGQKSIPEDHVGKNHHLERDVERAVHKCAGLPLTIEVMGSYLRDRNSPAFWEETINMLGKAESLGGLYLDRVWSLLKASYDSLSEKEQRVFIDAATYFYEQPLEHALAAWNSAYGNSHVIWESLLRKSMVKEVHKSTGDILCERETQSVVVWVHEQLRDLAKQLSFKGDDNINWLRANTSILQLPSEPEYDILSARSEMSLPSEMFNQFKRLRYLDLEDVMIEGLMKRLPRRLSLLRWKMRSMFQLPEIAFEEMKHLAVLELTNWKISKKFSEALGNLIELQILHLSQVEGLDHLPTNFGNLRRLKRLELVDLGLLMLPDSFGNLVALKYMALVNVNISALPESFGHLSSLRVLVLHGCTQLERLPESVGHLRDLQRLTIENADQIKVLPDSFVMLSGLEQLTIGNCEKLESLPESFGQLSALEVLVLRGCTQLETLPESLGQLSALQELLLHGCTQLKRLPESLGQLQALQTVTIEDSDELEALPESFGSLFSLKHLTLVSVGIRAVPESVGKLFSLQTLTVQDCEKLEYFPLSFKKLRISERLVVERCVQLERLPNTMEEVSAKLHNVTFLNASKLAFCDSLRMLPAVKHLTLVNVSIEGFPEPFQDLSSLVTLTIRSCLQLSSLPDSLGRLTSLEGLYIHNCPHLSSLPDSLGRLSSLKELCIYDCLVDRDEAAEAVVQAYFENTTLTAELHVDWNAVRDAALLRTKLKMYRDRNLRLKHATEKLKAPQEEVMPDEDEKHKPEDESKEKEKAKQESERYTFSPEIVGEVSRPVVKDGIKQEVSMPLTCAKVFLCGFQEVGKTTLRKSLKRCLQEDSWAKFKWERGPNCFPQTRTRGIEIRRIEEKSGGSGGSMTLNLWDLAGQEEYHVLHGNFFFFAGQGLGGGKATTFVLVLRVTFNEGDQFHLLYWLRFIASGSPVKRHVVIVLNHFGNFSSIDTDRWRTYIKKYTDQFRNLLNIHPEPFMFDVRVASKVKELKKHLFDNVREQLRGMTMPRLCHDVQEAVKLWPQGKMRNSHPILTWQAFEERLKLKSTAEQLNAAASYLHEMGDIIYFGKEESNNRQDTKDNVLVVPDPEWFCKEVVGKLLLPQEWLEGRHRQKNNNPERLSISDFKSLFERRLDQSTQSDDVISMLEYLGLCYRIQDEQLIVPTLTVGDFDYNSNGWEINKGVEEDTRVNWVMGRCLQAFEDNNNSSVPMALFRRLQVALAKDEDLGGCKSSDYRAGKSFSIFKLDRFMVLIQFDEAANDPNDDRVDVIVKSDVRTDSFARHINCICKVMQKLEDLWVESCPGIKFDIKVIEPWRATGEDLRMVARNIEVPLTEIKKKVKGDSDSCSTWQSHLPWKTFLSDSELEELLGVSPQERQKQMEEQEHQKEIEEQRDYDDCKQAAVDMGLVGSLEEVDLYEELEPPENLNSSEIQIWKIEQIITAGVRKICMHVDKRHHEVLSETRKEIRNKHELLVKKIQAQEAFSFEQAEHSVPRFMFLSHKSDRIWLKWREAWGRKTFQLHLLCEANVENGIMHEVDNQDGITITVNNEILLKIEPWVKWSLQVVLSIGKTIGNVYLPGVFSLIPDGLSCPDFLEESTQLILSKDDSGSKLVPDDRGNYGSKNKGVEAGSIAQAVIKRLIKNEGLDAFKKKMKLTKVCRKDRLDQPSVGPSKQAQSSVLWVCFECRDKYKDRVVNIG